MMGASKSGKAKITVKQKRSCWAGFIIITRCAAVWLFLVLTAAGALRLISYINNNSERGTAMRTPRVLAIITTDNTWPDSYSTALRDPIGALLSLRREQLALLLVFWPLLNWLLLAATGAVMAASLSYRLGCLLFGAYDWLRTLWRWRDRNVSGSHKFKVVEVKGGQPVAGARLLISSLDGRQVSRKATNQEGQVVLSLPVGHYVASVQAKGLEVTSAAPAAAPSAGQVIYTGGTLHVQQPDSPLVITIPMKPSSVRVNIARRMLWYSWQLLERTSHGIKWPILIVGSGLNTILLLWMPKDELLVVEVIYIFLVALRVWLDIQNQPAYGLVRDALSRLPLDLAIIRLYREGYSQLAATRVTDSQGKFFALPPAGEYTVVVSKDGYATLTEHNVRLKTSFSADLQIKADLMPVV